MKAGHKLNWQPGPYGTQSVKTPYYHLTVERIENSNGKMVWGWWMHHPRGLCLRAGEEPTEAKAKGAAEAAALEEGNGGDSFQAIWGNGRTGKEAGVLGTYDTYEKAHRAVEEFLNRNSDNPALGAWVEKREKEEA